MKNMKKEFNFSIVTAVYNCENYVEETILSLVNQTLNFKENVQLILVDDGSKDNSGAICDKYQKLYPENIIVVHKENGGVSSARNEGLKHATGKYINFIDSDDLLSCNTLQNVFDFFEAHENDIDVATIPIYSYFNNEILKKQNPNWTQKFNNGTRVIDLLKQHNCFLYSVATSFFHRRVKKELIFDTNLSYGEDTKVVNSILLNKLKLGVIKEAQYLYRIRNIGDLSLTANMTQKPSYYTPYLRDVVKYLIDYSKNKLGYIPRYLQLTLYNALKSRFSQKNIDKKLFLDDNGIENYQKYLLTCISEIDDDIIDNSPNAREIKIFCKSLKKDFKKKTTVDDICVYYQFLKKVENKIQISILCSTPLFYKNKPSLYLKINNKFIEAQRSAYVEDEIKLNNLVMYKKYYFNIEFELENNQEIQIYLKLKNTKERALHVYTQKFFPIANNYKNQYYYKDGYKFYFNKLKINISKIGKWGLIKSEIKYLLSLFKSGKRDFERLSVVARILYFFTKPFHRKKIWLISDRVECAGDNGEALFTYLKKNKIKGVKPYFVISGSSPDYKRMKKYGKVIKVGTKKHWLYTMLADAQISSQLDNRICSPVPFMTLGDILHKTKIIFLQHGVLFGDLSWLYNKYTFNFDMFVTSAQKEYQAIIDNPAYFCGEDITKLTGLPRHDKLVSTPKKLITFMPTWRHYLIDTIYGQHVPKKDFDKSSLYKNFYALLSNKKLAEAAEKYGYELEYFPHNNFRSTDIYFQQDSVFKLVEEQNRNYTKCFNESSLFITDYSSTQFDFAYLRKPLIYFQFDKEEFFEKHTTNQSFFDIEKHGFGEVVKDVDSLVDLIIEYMKNNCVMKDEYLKRTNEFFTFNDQNNCKRVVDEILKIKK